MDVDEEPTTEEPIHEDAPLPVGIDTKTDAPVQTDTIQTSTAETQCSPTTTYLEEGTMTTENDTTYSDGNR